MKHRLFAFATLAPLFLAPTSWTANATNPTLGFFVDEGNNEHGAAILDIHTSGSVPTGTLKLANQTLDLNATWTWTLITDGLNDWEKYHGDASRGGKSRPILVYHNATLGASVVEVLKPDLGTVVAYTTSPSDHDWLRQSVLSHRLNWTPRPPLTPSTSPTSPRAASLPIGASPS